MLLFSCADSESEPAPDAELQFNATVEYRDLEGGAWILESSDGTTYDPTDLPERYKEEGLPVRVWADRAKGQAGIRMIGPIISIEHVERRNMDE